MLRGLSFFGEYGMIAICKSERIEERSRLVSGVGCDAINVK